MEVIRIEGNTKEGLLAAMDSIFAALDKKAREADKKARMQEFYEKINQFEENRAKKRAQEPKVGSVSASESIGAFNITELPEVDAALQDLYKSTDTLSETLKHLERRLERVSKPQVTGSDGCPCQPSECSLAVDIRANVHRLNVLADQVLRMTHNLAIS